MIKRKGYISIIHCTVCKRMFVRIFGEWKCGCER